MMKKNNMYRYLMPVLGVSFAILIALTFSHLFAGLTAGAGVVQAIVGTPIVAEAVTVEGVQAAEADLDMDYVSSKIVEMKPSATPLDTIMRSVTNHKKILSFKSEFYAVDTRALQDTVKTAHTTSGDGSETFELEVNNIAAWNIDDTVKFIGVDGSDSDDLVCFIIAKTSTKIDIQPINGLPGSGTTAGELILPTIPISTPMVRMGNAKAELDAQTAPYAMIPAKDYNYVQLFMAQVQEGTYQKMHQKEVQWDFNDYEAMNIYDMKATMEFSYLYGFKSVLADKKATPSQRYFTGGVTREITKNLTYGTGGSNRTVNESDFVAWTKDIFTGNSGSDTRILFMGDELTANISLIDTVSKQLDAGKTEVKWGITWNKIETNFGILYTKHHRGMDLSGWSDNGIVLDINNVEKHNFLPMTAKKLDLITPGIQNANASVIAETSCLVLRYPDTHALIKPKA